MPQLGFCSDVTCRKEFTQLYECHCCNCSVCFDHLLEHVEISQRNRQRIDFLRQHLLTISSRLKLFLQKKLDEIEFERSIVVRADRILESSTNSIDELEKLCHQIEQIIATNRTDDEVVFNVESSLTIENEIPKHSIRLGSKDKSNELKTNENLFSTSNNDEFQCEKFLDENETIVVSQRKFPCPLSETMINLFGCPPKSSKRIPCRSKLSLGPSLLTHLSRYHNIRPRLAKPLLKKYEENLVKNEKLFE